MGRHKFRLSDMIPNAWFYKLRDMGAVGRAGQGAAARQVSASRFCRGRLEPSSPRLPSPLLQDPHRASYYYSRRAGEVMVSASAAAPEALDALCPIVPLSPPRKSKKQHRSLSTKMAPSLSGGVVSSVVSAGCRGSPKKEPVVEAADTTLGRRDMFIGCKDDGGDGLFRRPTVTISDNDVLDGKMTRSPADIIVDVRDRKVTENVLPRIATKPRRRELDLIALDDENMELSQMAPRTSSSSDQNKPKPRRSVSSGRRLKTRANSPRLAIKKVKPPPPPPPPLAQSFVVVKTTCDPRKDFRDSMEEMIAENGVRDAGDLEDLLACYLSLNAAEYHDLIVEVFEQIWISFSDIKL